MGKYPNSTVLSRLSMTLTIDAVYLYILFQGRQWQDGQIHYVNGIISGEVNGQAFAMHI
jgi:hypothetical protein